MHFKVGDFAVVEGDIDVQAMAFCATTPDSGSYCVEFVVSNLRFDHTLGGISSL